MILIADEAILNSASKGDGPYEFIQESILRDSGGFPEPGIHREGERRKN